MKHGYERKFNQNTEVWGWRLSTSHACFCLADSFLHVTLVFSRRILISPYKTFSFSSQAFHFVMQAAFRLNFLFQREPNARCSTGGGVCFVCFFSKHLSFVLLLLIAADILKGSGGKSRHDAYAVGSRANVL